VLNHALFERDGVRVVGAVVNKVDVESHPHLPDVLRRGLAQHGIDLLGCIPYSDLLANPSLELIATHLDGELLAGQATPGRTIGHVAIGAMQAEHAAGFIRDRTLLITPGDRDDMIEMALELNAVAEGQVTGIVLTGGFQPTDAMLEELRAASLFTYLVRSDTYRTAQAVDEILVKTHPTDTDKIETIIRLVDGSLDIADFLGHL
jgi:BioD-like phosphotransacetylase family protein